MATAYIYNGFGKYEANGAGKQGVTLKYAGIQFFFPFQEVTPIPDFTIRSVDHDKSTPDGESEGVLQYSTLTVPGKRIAEELLMTQIPFKNRDKGILQIEGKATGNMIEVFSGIGSSGEVLSTEVREVEATASEMNEARVLALEYKKTVIQDYFQSKRERMAGGHGQLHPTGMIKVFMAELNVEDIDDVARHQKTGGGLDIEAMKLLLEEVRKGNEINGAKLLDAVATVRSNGKAQLRQSGRPKVGGMEAYKEAYDAAIGAGLEKEVAKSLAIEARDAVVA